MDICEVSEMLGVTKATIYSWTSQKKIPHVKLSRRLLKFREREIKDWIAEKSVIVDSTRLPDKTRRAHTRKTTPRQLGSDHIEGIIRNAKEEVFHGR
ncbi:MAG TPA: helix-turn-helix domain-containing protein [Thermodesulfovibrionales bacterium]|nr:helix-turn-helix domain-containing protein [Thermodesulfovibrionales bacterium]